MEGLWRTDPISLRPRDDLAAPPLPRPVLRRLMAAGGLGVGSRVLISGNAAASVEAFFHRLGLDAVAADAGPVADLHDAVIRLDLEPAQPGFRSLLSPPSLEHTAELLGAVRPNGVFLFVTRLGGSAGGHGAACLERHVATFPGQTRLTVFPTRPVFGFFRREARMGFTVAAWQAPAASVDPVVWHRRAAGVPFTPCCRWADEPSRPRRVA